MNIALTTTWLGSTVHVGEDFACHEPAGSGGGGWARPLGAATRLMNSSPTASGNGMVPVAPAIGYSPCGTQRGFLERTMTTELFKVTHTDDEWRRRLTPEQYRVMRSHGTEPPGSCALLHEKRPGTFSCAGCGQPLFQSKLKFESGTGWPSFNAPVEGAVETSVDRGYGTVRTEVHCANCGSHLGHVFEDGPPPTGLRYCINGIAMNFVPD
jgi:peptide-methionine (R)-S-oxide reductase